VESHGFGASLAAKSLGQHLQVAIGHCLISVSKSSVSSSIELPAGPSGPRSSRELRNHSTVVRSSGLLGSGGEGIRVGSEYQVVSNHQDAVVKCFDLSLSQHATYQADDAARVLGQSSRHSTSYRA
jgi:hypothetical protein